MTNKVKVGIDASRFTHKYSNGLELYSYEIINGLLGLFKKHQRDYEVTMYLKKRQPERIQGVHQKVIKRDKLWTKVGLTNELVKNKQDVLFCPSLSMPLTTPKKTIVTIHDVGFKYLKGLYSASDYLKLQMLTKRSIKAASKIIVPSTSTRNDLMEFYGCPAEKIIVIPHGFTRPKAKISRSTEDRALKKFHISRRTKYVYFLGPLEERKNILHLIKGFERFNQKHPKYRLVLAGKPAFGYDEIEKAIKNSPVGYNIIETGYVSENEKAVLMKRASIFASPSLYEGFGFTILEAFYHGTPVLTSAVGSIPEVGGNAILTVNPELDASIAIGLSRLAENEDLRESMVERGKELLKKYSWKTATEKTFDVITS